MKQLTSIAILCCILTLISCGGQKQEVSKQELAVGGAKVECGECGKECGECGP